MSWRDGDVGRKERELLWCGGVVVWWCGDEVVRWCGGVVVRWKVEVLW